MKMGRPKAVILYVVFGVGIIYLISGAFIQSVIQFSNAARIPFLFTSFVMAPLSMNTKMIIMALLDAGPRVSKNASLTFSEVCTLYSLRNLTILVIYTLCYNEKVNHVKRKQNQLGRFSFHIFKNYYFIIKYFHH